jgi:hypothetical protein
MLGWIFVDINGNTLFCPVRQIRTFTAHAQA